jgi:hypothetical protein
MNVLVTMKFLIRDCCSEGDFGPGELHETLDSLVRDLIESEGITGIAEDQGEILAIKEVR